MNFLFQDDASHYLNFSSNLVYEVKGAGSEEGGMIKSVGSVFENNVVANSMLGHVFNLCPCKFLCSFRLPSLCWLTVMVVVWLPSSYGAFGMAAL